MYTLIIAIKHSYLFISCMAAFFVLQSNNIAAQLDTLSEDSTQLYFSDNGNRVTEYFTENTWQRFLSIDTSILQMHRFNPVRNQDIPFAYLTNLGAPYYNRLFSFNRELGLDLGRHTVDLYQNHMSDLKYYRTNAPFTEIFYLLGTKGEQWIRFTHSQNLSPRLNFALHFDKPVAVGYYLRERKSYSNADLTMWWRSKNVRYKVYLGVIFNELTNEENGGISVDTLFNGYEGPRNLAEIYRESALTDWWSIQAQVTHTYDFGKMVEYRVNDTTNATVFKPESQLMHRFGLANYDYNFRDATGDDTYYPVIYLEQDTLTDRSDLDGFYNYIAFGNRTLQSIDSVPFIWEISALQQSYNLSDGSGSYNKNFLVTGANVSLPAAGKFLLNADAKYDVIQNDYDFKVSASTQFSDILAGLMFRSKKISPDWMAQHYYGFAYRWENTFKDITTNEISVFAEAPKLFSKVGVSLLQYTNFIFYDSTAVPFQASDPVRSVQLSLKQHFKFGDFYLDNFFQLQFLDSYKKNFPVYASNHSFYFMHNLFQSALIVQTGFDIWYSSNYYGYGYNIVNGQFYLQNTTLLNFKPVMDVFINFDIRALRFFVKFDNLSMGWLDNGYFEAPAYPMQDRTFKIGIVWQLYY